MIYTATHNHMLACGVCYALWSMVHGLCYVLAINDQPYARWMHGCTEPCTLSCRGIKMIVAVISSYLNAKYDPCHMIYVYIYIYICIYVYIYVYCCILYIRYMLTVIQIHAACGMRYARIASHVRCVQIDQGFRVLCAACSIQTLLCYRNSQAALVTNNT